MTRKSPSEHVFVLTLPLHCEQWQRDRLDKIFRVCNDIKNNLIACEKVRFDHLSRQRAWKRNQEALADAYKKKDKKAIKQYGKIRTEMLEKAGFSLYQFEAQANKYRKHYKGPNGKGYLVSVHVCQKVAASVWKSFETLLYKTGEDVHFSPWSEFTAISGKSNETGIVYSDGIVSFGKMELSVMVDKKDPYGYQEEALSREIRYCGISRRWYANGWKYFVQITLDGLPPIKCRKDTGEILHPIGSGRVGHDIGPQTIASIGAENIMFVELADRVKGIDAELRRINRAMDRSRRVTNPGMYNQDGTIIRKDKLPKELLNSRNNRNWIKSKHYMRLEGKRRELYRRQREMRIRQHNELANKLLSFGDRHYIEEMRFRGLAKRTKETKTNANGKNLSKKRFGKSISNKAPASFVKILERKVIFMGGTFQKVNTFTVKASQLNHISQTYTKKNLSKRWNDMPDGKKVQRDLYSAFLIMNVDDSLGAVDVSLCHSTYQQFLELHDREVQRISQFMQSAPSSMGIRLVG